MQAAALLVALRVQRDAALEGDGAAAAEADRRLAEAQAQLALLAETLKAAQTVRTGAGKVVSGLEAVHEALVRSLLQARAALAAGAAADGEAGAAA
ncbi:hypothetical protein [Actinopolymorpha rutila]|uniref:Uncharacterized protein n=1 Tax=Actinopolymorpha rutila TaxID=446787 RepID=A0A852ZK28_9ACTN|nr:hypothetical protein [Actinopolymorpha rutila]NYH92485.1 hypothetical protein [Actinopolymorpha rutila]